MNSICFSGLCIVKFMKYKIKKFTEETFFTKISNANHVKIDINHLINKTPSFLHAKDTPKYNVTYLLQL
jgi:hypothetical protein